MREDPPEVIIYESRRRGKIKAAVKNDSKGYRERGVNRGLFNF